jgi:hypothetical protein
MDTADFNAFGTRSGGAQPPTPLADTINILVATDAPMLDVALAYARAGFPVFPINPGTKSPLVSGGHHRATTDEADVRAWWSQWPEAMPGIPMGPASGLWAVDADRRDDPAEPKKNLDGVGLRRSSFKVEAIACRVRSAAARASSGFAAARRDATQRGR